VKAGNYAVYRGHEYRCVSVHPRDPRRDPLRPDAGLVGLSEDGNRPCPDGFAADRWMEWTLWVPGDQVSRLTLVETTATWTGSTPPHPSVVRGTRVDVVRVWEHAGGATISPTPTPALDRPTGWTVDGGRWYADVAIRDLADPVERIWEVLV